MAATGESLPPSTLARIEQGKLEPGVRRLHLLLRLYDIDAEQVADMVEFETAGVSLPDHGDLRRLLVEASEHWNSGRDSEAIAYWLAAMECEPVDEETHYARQRGALDLAYAMKERSRLGIARRIVDRLLCEELSPRVKWMVYHLSAMLWSRRGSLEMARLMLSCAREFAGPDNHQAYAAILQQQARYDLEEGEFARAEEAMEHVERHAEAAGHQSMIGRVRLFRGYVAMTAGDFELARDCFERALELAEEHGYELQRRSAMNQLGLVLIEFGEYDRALHLLRSAHGQAVEAGDRSGEFDALYRLWKLHLATGDLENARIVRAQARLLTGYVEEKSAEVDEILAG